MTNHTVTRAAPPICCYSVLLLLVTTTMADFRDGSGRSNGVSVEGGAGSYTVTCSSTLHGDNTGVAFPLDAAHPSVELTIDALGTVADTGGPVVAIGVSPVDLPFSHLPGASTQSSCNDSVCPALTHAKVCHIGIIEQAGIAVETSALLATTLTTA